MTRVSLCKFMKSYIYAYKILTFEEKITLIMKKNNLGRRAVTFQ